MAYTHGRGKITPEVLAAAGYWRFTNNPLERHKPTYVASYQKRFDDEHGKRYFITFDEHHFDWPDGGDQISMECNAHMTRDGATFELQSVQTFNSTLACLEAFVADVWEKLGCEYYERFSHDDD